MVCVWRLQKEEMGEVLHEVDFNQLKIENQQYIEKIDERNQDLLRLKLMAGNTLQVLNTYKVAAPPASQIHPCCSNVAMMLLRIECFLPLEKAAHHDVRIAKT